MAKKVFMYVVIISLLFLSIPVYDFEETDDHLAIELNGAEIGTSAYIDGGNVYLPLRVIGETLGYNVQWSGKKGTISVSKTGKNIVIDLKDDKISANDHVYYMSYAYEKD